jgi:hypothetical protein
LGEILTLPLGAAVPTKNRGYFWMKAVREVLSFVPVAILFIPLLKAEIT